MLSYIAVYVPMESIFILMILNVQQIRALMGDSCTHLRDCTFSLSRRLIATTQYNLTLNAVKQK